MAIDNKTPIIVNVHAVDGHAVALVDDAVTPPEGSKIAKAVVVRGGGLPAFITETFDDGSGNGVTVMRKTGVTALAITSKDAKNWSRFTDDIMTAWMGKGDWEELIGYVPDRRTQDRMLGWYRDMQEGIILPESDAWKGDVAEKRPRWVEVNPQPPEVMSKEERAALRQAKQEQRSRMAKIGEEPDFDMVSEAVLDLFNQGFSASGIRKRLISDELPPMLGMEKWTPKVIYAVLAESGVDVVEFKANQAELRAAERKLRAEERARRKAAEEGLLDTPEFKTAREFIGKVLAAAVEAGSGLDYYVSPQTLLRMLSDASVKRPADAKGNRRNWRTRDLPPLTEPFITDPKAWIKDWKDRRAAERLERTAARQARHTAEVS